MLTLLLVFFPLSLSLSLSLQARTVRMYAQHIILHTGHSCHSQDMSDSYASRPRSITSLVYKTTRYCVNNMNVWQISRKHVLRVHVHAGPTYVRIRSYVECDSGCTSIWDHVGKNYAEVFVSHSEGTSSYAVWAARTYGWAQLMTVSNTLTSWCMLCLLCPSSTVTSNVTHLVAHVHGYCETLHSSQGQSPKNEWVQGPCWRAVLTRTTNIRMQPKRLSTYLRNIQLKKILSIVSSEGLIWF